MEQRTALLIPVILVLAVIIIYYSVPQTTIHVTATTTTSLYATGLLDKLSEEFTKKHPGVSIDFIPVGSGEALRRAADGEACLVLVHVPSLEKEYIDKGVITQHRIFAYNYFVIAGPPNDPANISTANTATEAFQRIYMAGEEGRALFVSRGDNSGTHVKELSIWSKTGLDPHGKDWYIETGSGMAQTLIVANEKKAYVLTDIGTYLKLKGNGRLPNIEVLFTNSSELINIYSVYLVTSCSGQEKNIAEEFIDFITSEEGQKIIAQYGVEEYGRPLFYPAINETDRLHDIWVKLSKE